MEEQNNYEKFFEDAKDYLETKVELTKLQAVDKGSDLIASTAVGILLLVFFTMVFLFGSLALAFYISEISGKAYTGFMCLAGLYLILGIIVYLGRESWIKKPITNLFISKILKEDEED